MTSAQCAAAYQLAAALHDAMPAGTFDEAGFLDRMFSDVDIAAAAPLPAEDLRSRRAS